MILINLVYFDIFFSTRNVCKDLINIRPTSKGALRQVSTLVSTLYQPWVSAFGLPYGPYPPADTPFSVGLICIRPGIGPSIGPVVDCSSSYIYYILTIFRKKNKLNTEDKCYHRQVQPCVSYLHKSLNNKIVITRGFNRSVYNIRLCCYIPISVKLPWMQDRALSPRLQCLTKAYVI